MRPNIYRRNVHFREVGFDFFISYRFLVVMESSTGKYSGSMIKPDWEDCQAEENCDEC